MYNMGLGGTSHSCPELVDIYGDRSGKWPLFPCELRLYEALVFTTLLISSAPSLAH